MPICGHTTNEGTPCRWGADECPHHRDDGQEARPNRPSGRTPKQPARRIHDPGPKHGRSENPRPFHPEAVANRDLPELAWWTIETVLDDELETPRAAVVATLMRIIAGLPEHGDPGDYGWERSALEARMANGLLPRNQEEWELASRIVDEETLAELHRRQALGQNPDPAPLE